MASFRLLADSYFDGNVEHGPERGPYLIVVRRGLIETISPGAGNVPADIHVPFVMPGMVEAHAHLFLDGAELDFDKRNAYLKADKVEMLEVARANIERSAAMGITLIRDAGDKYGVNDAIRDEQAAKPAPRVAVRSPGLGIKRPKRYGAFMARDIEPGGDVASIVAEIAATADDIKIILTGIIDFVSGDVKGAPQFNEDELRAIVEAARKGGRRTFAHCSGLDGLKVAVTAGVDSIEHGFFMTGEILDVMAEKNIAWVPTVSPVHFQWERPEIARWDDATIGNLRRILDSHLEHIGLAHRKGVQLVAGSDAGSPGVPHGVALIDELFHFLNAGVPMAATLTTATSRPRRLWDLPPVDIRIGNSVELIAMDASPFGDAQALKRTKSPVAAPPFHSNA